MRRTWRIRRAGASRLASAPYAALPAPGSPVIQTLIVQTTLYTDSHPEEPPLQGFDPTGRFDLLSAPPIPGAIQPFPRTLESAPRSSSVSAHPRLAAGRDGRMSVAGQGAPKTRPPPNRPRSRREPLWSAHWALKASVRGGGSPSGVRFRRDLGARVRHSATKGDQTPAPGGSPSRPVPVAPGPAHCDVCFETPVDERNRPDALAHFTPPSPSTPATAGAQTGARS